MAIASKLFLHDPAARFRNGYKTPARQFPQQGGLPPAGTAGKNHMSGGCDLVGHGADPCECRQADRLGPTIGMKAKEGLADGNGDPVRPSNAHTWCGHGRAEEKIGKQDLAYKAGCARIRCGDGLSSHAGRTSRASGARYRGRLELRLHHPCGRVGIFPLFSHSVPSPQCGPLSLRRVGLPQAALRSWLACVAGGMPKMRA